MSGRTLWHVFRKKLQQNMDSQYLRFRLPKLHVLIQNCILVAPGPGAAAAFFSTGEKKVLDTNRRTLLFGDMGRQRVTTRRQEA